MIIEKEWLLDHYSDVRVIDCRFHLQNKEFGKWQYEKGHLPNAVYFHLEEDLSGVVTEHGGRHPLPDLEQFKAKLEAAGINNDDTVIAYDEATGPFATRFLWLMKYIGHEKVYVLNGGYAKWKEAGWKVDSEIPSFSKSTYTIQVQEELLASYEEVKRASVEGGTVLLDSRESQRYKGMIEPIDRIAGHIPNAVNMPWEDGLKDGMFLDSTQQKERFAELNPNQEIIVYCGSGVTATPNFVALKSAGFQQVKVYIGSYSDWVSYKDNPIETNED
ncbi:MAG: sulfurtransferase [Bacillus sp. (in: firmicutes)]